MSQDRRGQMHCLGLCVAPCPTKTIVDFIPTRPKAFVMDNCIGCRICMKVCPVNATSGENKKKHVIDAEVHRLRNLHSQMPGAGD